MRIGLPLALSQGRTAGSRPPMWHAGWSCCRRPRASIPGHTHQIAVTFGISNNNLTNAGRVA